MMESMNNNKINSYYNSVPGSGQQQQQKLQEPQQSHYLSEFNGASLRNGLSSVYTGNQQQYAANQYQAQPSSETQQPQIQLQQNLQSSLLLSPPLSSASIKLQQQQTPGGLLNFSSLYSSRARFNASKGFDIEDDLEFCPMTQAQRMEEAKLQQQGSPQQHVNPYANYFTNGSGSSTSTGHKYNPYSSSFSPSSPSLNGNTSLSNSNMNGNYVTSSSVGATVGSDLNPRVMTPRNSGKRFEQLNGTGQGTARVASPRHAYK